MKLPKDTQKKGEELRSIFLASVLRHHWYCSLYTLYSIWQLPLSQHSVINFWLLVTFATFLRFLFIFRDVFLSNVLGFKTGKMNPREIPWFGSPQKITELSLHLTCSSSFTSYIFRGQLFKSLLPNHFNKSLHDKQIRREEIYSYYSLSPLPAHSPPIQAHLDSISLAIEQRNVRIENIIIKFQCTKKGFSLTETFQAIYSNNNSQQLP